MGRLDLQELLKVNPQVDASDLEEQRELAERLKESGLEARPYRIAAPGERRRAQIMSGSGERHAVQLPRMSRR